MQKKLTIYTVADSFFPNIGGMEKVAECSATLLGQEHNSIIFAPRVKGYTDNLPIKVFRVKSFPIETPRLMFALPKFDKSLKKFVKENPPDIIHVHNQSPLSKWFLKYGNKHNIPTFMTVHGYIENDIDATKFKPLKAILKKYFLKTISLAKTVFAVSEGNKKYYEQFGIKPILLRNGIDNLTSKPEFEKKLLNTYSITKDDNVMCFVNRLIKIKNVDLLIESFRILKEKNFNFKVLIAGDGDETQNMKNMVKKYDLESNVFFLGKVVDRQEVAAIYKISDLHLFPSVKDNSSLSIGESASQKTPTLAMENCSSVELIVKNENGFLSKNTPEDYANNIVEIFKNKQNIKKVGEKAFETLFISWKTYKQKVLTYYQEKLK